MPQPRMQLAGIVLDSPDALELCLLPPVAGLNREIVRSGLGPARLASALVQVSLDRTSAEAIREK